MSDLLLEIDGPVARVTLNRPQAFNALNAGIRDAMRAAIATIDADDAVRVVILSGAGRGFCAGTDLAENLGGQSTTDFILREYQPLLSAIAASPKLWIAQVHGSAAGIGAALALVCDLMTIAETATLYLAFAAIGLVPDGGTTWQLHRALGPRHALQTILEGRRIPADEAVARGLANAAHPEAELAPETAALALRLTRGAPLAAAAAKRLMRVMDGLSLDAAIAAEAQEQGPLARSADAREGMTAFFEKRAPVFRGA
ncbi:MAG: enoyl-CoA hydratase/isomerase family protein [Rhodobacter sp.]|nr:enoyl-CoA hydratase/isomerase family protein [Paracoccaceae bacterium]MCC0077126.1 enoyl-CoA hydratase/isomerase family protein [Rhodobacter sp.]